LRKSDFQIRCLGRNAWGFAAGVTDFFNFQRIAGVTPGQFRASARIG
jgi:hypothetical protein